MNPSVDPNSSNAIGAAVQWIGATLSGSIATAIAVIAIASVGILMLSGRIDVRRAAQVLVGCFVLFGASSIAAGIMRSLNGEGAGQSTAAPPPPPPSYPATDARAPASDPYAGAAVPPRR